MLPRAYGLRRLIGAGLRITPATAALIPVFWQWRHRRRAAQLYARYRAHTMLSPEAFADNLSLCRTVASYVPGVVIECGVWRGGMSAAMAEILGADRTYYLFDSFEGLPDADPTTDGAWAIARLANAASHPYGRVAAAEADAEAAMRMSGARRYHLIKGWFEHTLPKFVPPAPIAVLRLDADLYRSTRQCLDALYPYVAPGGLVLIDDYYSPWAGCARAVHEYLGQQPEPTTRLRQSPASVAYLCKPV